jgi:putative hemolysin
MDPEYYFIGLILFIILSAFFSSSETAFFSLTKIQLKKLELQSSKSSKRIIKLLKKPRHLLITILLGNTIVNVISTAIAALILLQYATVHLQYNQVPLWMLLGSMFIMTTILVIFGEISPKLFAIAKAESLARFSSLFILFLSRLLWPLIFLLVTVSRIFATKAESYSLKNQQNFTSEDLMNIVDSKSKHHPLNESEKKIISGIFKFTSIEAKKIMLPRVDIKSISVTEGLDRIKEYIITSGHSRLPVYRSNIDDIVGIVYAKDIILNPALKSINTILRKPIYVTEKTKIQALLNIFRTRKTHLAIVVDEYGGTSGLITLEDILEELVGEIVDEYDKEQPLLSTINNNEYLASGMLSIFDLNEVLELNIDEEKYDNLAAFLYDKFNRVPVVNERLNYENKAVFVVVAVKGQRIESVKIVKTIESDDFYF